MTTSLTTPQALGALLKSARDIMRKDKGLNGDLDRLPLLTWMMFLKFLDDLDLQGQEEALLSDKPFKPTVEAPYRWRDWAATPHSITGDELLAFINNEDTIRPDGSKGAGLFRYLRGLSGISGDDRREVIATVFKGVDNRMKSGYILRDVINKIGGIHFTSSDELHTLGALYESMLREMRDAAGDSGEFYTPRSVVRFMVAVTDPRMGETVLDPAAGTGGFLVEAFNHLSKQVKTVADRQILQEKSLHGCEPKSLPYLLCQMNLLLHGLDAPRIDSHNALRHKLTEIGESQRVDVILTNPPFGGEEERGIQGNFPEDKRTADTALLFLQLIMRKLRRKGKAGFPPPRSAVIVPDGTLSETGVAAAVRKELLATFNLTTIIQLPPGAFAPYAETARTNILFFDSAESTGQIWFYQLPAPDGKKQCSKTNCLTDLDFEPICAWWNDRKENSRAWIVKKSDLDPVTCDLLRRNPTVETPKEDLDLPTLIKRATDVVRNIVSDLEELETEFPSGGLQTRHLSSLLKRSQNLVSLDETREYMQLTIQYHHRGVRLRTKLKGVQISTRRQFGVTKGQLVLSRIDARYGAIGFVPEELDGAIITGDFWAFDVNQQEVIPDYLDLFFALPEFAKLCERASRGTTRRQRLNFNMFNRIAIPWLPLELQEAIVTKVLAARRVARQIEDLKSDLHSLPFDLVRQRFGRAWIEENVEQLHVVSSGDDDV